jgi:predicted ATP-grasp superfamily ATP-dependent carboligase
LPAPELTSIQRTFAAKRRARRAAAAGSARSGIAGLVTDVDHRSVVAGLRALGRAGIRTVAVGSRPDAAGLWSRYATVRAQAPSVLDDARKFAARIAELAHEHGPVVVYAGREESIDALAAALPRNATPALPAADVLERIRDKRLLGALAAAVGLSTPTTIAEATATALRTMRVELPCVIKEARPGGAVELTSVIETQAELDAFLHRLPGGQELIVQERAPGPLVAVGLVLARSGSLAARFQQVTRRTWPARGGGSSVAVSVAPDDQLVGQAAELLRRAGFWGLAQVQFVTTAAGPALIDVNPRFYGTLPLALACGVNLPAVWHAVATGEDPPAPADYRVGVSYRWLEGDVTASLQGFPRRLLDRPPAPRTGAVWARDDPAPSLLLTLQTATSRLERRVRAPGGGRRPA